MQTAITDEHNEALEWFELCFSDYGFKIELVVDETIQDYHGEEFQTVGIKITDPDDLEDQNWLVMLDKNNNFHYNVYEDIVDELRTPDDLWKYMYFDATAKLRGLTRR